MSQSLRQRLFDELDGLVLVDPHTHINPHRPAAETLADILGYHYYTELAHSAGRESASKKKGSARKKKSPGWSSGSAPWKTRFSTVG